MTASSVTSKPYNSAECPFATQIAVGGVTVTLRTDSKTFLKQLENTVFGTAFTPGQDEVPAFECCCVTRCEAPWTIAIETPESVRLMRPHRHRDAAFELFEWSPSGCLEAGETYVPFPERTRPDDASMVVVASYVRRSVLVALIRRSQFPFFRVLHAAALRYRGRGLLILGDSRGGKTTLALAGVLAGMQYLAEDYAILDPADLLLHPFPTALRVRQGTLSLSPLFEKIPSDAITDMSGDLRWLVDPCKISGRAVAEASPLTHIVRLDTRLDRPRLEPVSAIDIAQACVLAEVMPRTDAPLDALWRWTDRIKHLQTARLHPGPLDETVALLKTWLDRPAGEGEG